MRRRGAVPGWRFVISMVLLSLLAVGCGGGSGELAGIVRMPLPSVGDVELPDTTGTTVVMRARPGGVLIVYFGFTSCPDVCPTTMAEVRSALAGLGDDAGLVDVAMITVDPMRDTPEVLGGYVRSFVPTGLGLRTEDDSLLRSAAAAFGAAYDVTVDVDGEVQVAHTAHLYGVDDAGMLRVTWPFGTQATDLAADLELLMGG